MERKKHTDANDRLSEVVTKQELCDVTGAHGLVERWMGVIRRRMPLGSVLSATVQAKPQIGFVASFRLTSEGETLSSEAREASPEEAVQKAGMGLCEHLPLVEERAGEPDWPRAG